MVDFELQHHFQQQAVVDVDYSPTGKELVSGSYDKTVRLSVGKNADQFFLFGFVKV